MDEAEGKLILSLLLLERHTPTKLIRSVACVSHSFYKKVLLLVEEKLTRCQWNHFIHNTTLLWREGDFVDLPPPTSGADLRPECTRWIKFFPKNSKGERHYQFVEITYEKYWGNNHEIKSEGTWNIIDVESVTNKMSKLPLPTIGHLIHIHPTRYMQLSQRWDGATGGGANYHICLFGIWEILENWNPVEHSEKFSLPHVLDKRTFDFLLPIDFFSDKSKGCGSTNFILPKLKTDVPSV